MTDSSFTTGHPALAPGVTVTREGLRLQFSRGGGPGGQNVNKLNTRVQVWLRLDQLSGLSPPALQRLRRLAGRRLTAADEIHFGAQTHRTQQANLQEVYTRLRELILRAQVEPKRRRKTRPSAGSRQRRLESKRHRARLKAQRGGEL
jgi:ribosome-associated protein